MSEKKKPLTPESKLSRRSFIKGLGAGILFTPSIAAFSIPPKLPPLKIGCLAPLTGFFAREGEGCKRGFELATSILGDMGMPVEIILVNTESNPDRARTAAEKLINDGVNILIGSFSSSETATIAQVAEQRKIPLIINIAAAPKITEQGYKFVFRNFCTGTMLAEEGFKLMKTLFDETGVNPETAVLLHVNDTFGVSVRESVDFLLPKLDLPFRILQKIAYDPHTKDLSVEIAKAKATNADLMLPVCHGVDAIVLLRQMIKRKWSPTGVITPGSPGFYDSQFIKSLGKYSEFVIANVPWINPQSPMSIELKRRFYKMYPGEEIELNAGFSFEAALIAAEARKQAGSHDREMLAAALRKIHISQHVMVGGPIEFNAKGQNVNIRSVTLQNVNRKPTVVLPKEIAEMEPIFPMPAWTDRRRV
ncbi:MAG: ABC transporter substrate-binding protein [Alphaproteobacteria bacterium]|nr:ABC transporter substrate-binding protein [Alphaproteobacteria bacterium]